jgi:hypothetical protein
MEQNENPTAPEASTDEHASFLSHAQPEPPAPAGDDWPEFATRAESMAFWQGIRRGISESQRDRAHPHMPRHFSLDLGRDGAAPTLISAKLLDPWPHIPDDEASRGLTSHGPAEAAPRADRHDGFTPAAEQLFLRTLADTGVVADACRATGVTRQAAYARRRSASGRAFALAWDAAQLIARTPLGDDVLSRSRHGVIDRVYRNGELVAERHRYDNRLSMAVLTRLDRLAEGHGENAPVIRAVAQEFDQFLGLLPEGLQAAEEFVAARFPQAEGGRPPRPVREPLGSYGKPAPSGTEEGLLARLGCYEEYGAGLPEEIDTDDLDPGKMERWTGEQMDRAKASGFLKMLHWSEWPEAARNGTADGTDGMCQIRQLYLAYNPAKAPEAQEDDFAGCDVWEASGGWMTNFPPPSGFEGCQEGEPGSEDYQRELAPEELPRIAGEDAIDNEERESLLAEQEAARRRFFGLEDRETAATVDGHGKSCLSPQGPPDPGDQG